MISNDDSRNMAARHPANKWLLQHDANSQTEYMWSGPEPQTCEETSGGRLRDMENHAPRKLQIDYTYVGCFDIMGDNELETLELVYQTPGFAPGGMGPVPDGLYVSVREGCFVALCSMWCAFVQNKLAFYSSVYSPKTGGLTYTVVAG